MKFRVSIYDFLVNFQENLDHVRDLASELASKSSMADLASEFESNLRTLDWSMKRPEMREKLSWFCLASVITLLLLT